MGDFAGVGMMDSGKCGTADKADGNVFFGYMELHWDLKEGKSFGFQREQSVLMSRCKTGLSITLVISELQGCLDSERIRACGVPNTQASLCQQPAKERSV